MNDMQKEYKAMLSMARNYVRALEKNCPHSIVMTFAESCSCEVCGKHYGWHCPNSPDHVCHYYTEKDADGKLYVWLIDGAKDHNFPRSAYSETDDWCIYCGEPEERK